MTQYERIRQEEIGVVAGGMANKEEFLNGELIGTKLDRVMYSSEFYWTMIVVISQK